MHIAITGATGFLGHYLVRRFIEDGHTCRCWHRASSDRSDFEQWSDRIEWIPGELYDEDSTHKLMRGVNAVVHGALHRGTMGVRDYAELNVIGSLMLFEAAMAAHVPKFVFISSCAVHDVILDDRPLDETHPLWPSSYYGAYKAAVEKYVHSYGFGHGYPICAIRPSGIYGMRRPIQHSKWFDLVHAVARGQKVTCTRGGKEVHAADVARAVALLLSKDNIVGQAYNCVDMYVSEWNVAHIAKRLSGSNAIIEGEDTRPKHMIFTEKIKSLGMTFGGQQLLEQNIAEMLNVLSKTGQMV